MGQRYGIHFKDYNNDSYEVRIYIAGYSGSVTELRGARSAFVVTGDDEGFVYNPIRTSTATINILDKNLLLDLFSINNQYAPVKLYKNGSLIWTGYITPEQFTQPYLPTVETISVDCVSAISTLENIKYEQQTESGFITAMDLLRYLISSASGGYEYVYIPHVYASSLSAYQSGENVLDKIELAEENFTSDELMLSEVLTYLMQFFSWTLYDYEGSLYIIDADYTGQYRQYNEELTSYTMASKNSATLQDIGFAGNNNTIDVLPGFNKVTVKSINNVFDKILEEEDYNLLRQVGGILYSNISNWISRKKFLSPNIWELFYYNGDGGIVTELPSDSSDINDKICGAVLLKEASVEGKLTPDGVETEQTEWNWTDSIQMRSITTDGRRAFSGNNTPILRIKGANAVWAYGAIAISGSARYAYGKGMVKGFAGYDSKKESSIHCKLRIGKYYWNGLGWTTVDSTFDIPMEAREGSDERTIKNTKKIDMPYSGLSGYTIVIPDNMTIIGDVEFTMYGIPWSLDISGGIDNTIYGIVFKNLKIDYKKKDGIIDEGESGDRVYENVVNEKFMSELDEVEFGISSYNEDGATYSKALLNGGFLTDNLYSSIENRLVRPEESFIRRVINRYRETKIKLTQVIKNDGSIHPFTVLYDKSMVNKRFMVLSGVWDYEQNNIQLTMIENGN